MEGRARIGVKARVIPLAPVDWGGGDLRDVVLLEITTAEGITGLGSAYTGADQLHDALALYQQDPEALHKADFDEFKLEIQDVSANRVTLSVVSR